MTVVKTSLKSIKDYLIEEYRDIYAVHYDDGVDIIYNGDSLFGLNNELPLTESKAWSLAYDVLELNANEAYDNINYSDKGDIYNKSPKKFKYKKNEY